MADNKWNAAFAAAEAAKLAWITAQSLLTAGDRMGGMREGGRARDHQYTAIELFLEAAHDLNGDNLALVTREVEGMIREAELMYHAAACGELQKFAVASDLPAKSHAQVPDAETVSGTVRAVSTRQKIVQEMLDTERSYIAALRTFLEVFGEPLQRSPTPRAATSCATQVSSPAAAPAPASSPVSNIAAAVGSLFKLITEGIDYGDCRDWMSEAQYNGLFQPVAAIVPLHDMLFKQLEESLRNWREDICIGM